MDGRTRINGFPRKCVQSCIIVQDRLCIIHIQMFVGTQVFGLVNLDIWMIEDNCGSSVS